MKHLIHILLLFVGISASAQYFNPDKPMIKPFEINVRTINNEMHDTHGHDMLYQDAGFVCLRTIAAKCKLQRIELVNHSFEYG